jgi:N-acetylglucosaminyl-diphospho-decaprenol L-rhamnosyltransferase
VRATSAPYVLLLNDDTEVRPGAIAELVGPLKDRPQVGATAPRLVYPDLTFQPSIFDDLTIRSALEMLVVPIVSRWPASRLGRVPRRTFPTAPEPVEWVAAAALLVRRTLYDRLGGLDERYPHGIEDAAFCREARRLGYTILAVPSAEVIHHGSPSGLRSQDPRRLAATLTRGVRGWELYFRVYSPGSERWIRPIFALHAATRYVAFATMRWRGPATRNRAAAYREHARRMLSR